MYSEIPPNVNRKFFNYPAIVPKEFNHGFMPKANSQYNMTEIERWCTEQFGTKGKGWERRSLYFFFKESDAFVFKMRWC